MMHLLLSETLNEIEKDNIFALALSWTSIVRFANAFKTNPTMAIARSDIGRRVHGEVSFYRDFFTGNSSKAISHSDLGRSDLEIWVTKNREAIYIAIAVALLCFTFYFILLDVFQFAASIGKLAAVFRPEGQLGILGYFIMPLVMGAVFYTLGYMIGYLSGGLSGFKQEPGSNKDPEWDQDEALRRGDRYGKIGFGLGVSYGIGQFIGFTAGPFVDYPAWG